MFSFQFEKEWEKPSAAIQYPIYFNMLIDLEQISTLYQSISTKALQQKTPILILVATDVDALTSCRMLTVSINGISES